MKPVTIATTILMMIALLSFTGCSVSRPSLASDPLPNQSQDTALQTETIYSTLCEPIGLNDQPLDLCVENREGTPEYYQSSVYYLKTPTEIRPLPYGGFSTYRMLVSPGRNYVVIEENAGEGHLIFSIDNLDDVRASKENPTGCGGWDDLVGYDELEWRGEQLHFSATQILLTENAPTTEDEIIYRYRLTPADNCRLELLGSSQPDQLCLAGLDHYLTNEAPVDQLRMYLNVQYQVTAYRVLASMLAQRQEQQRAFRHGKRAEKAIPRYSLQLKEHIESLHNEAGDDPQFLEAKKSFEEAPLSISTLAKLAPFVERSILKNSRIYDQDSYSANFRLDNADFEMLDFLADVEANRAEALPRTTFVNHIENYDEERLVEMDHNVNLLVVDEYSIQPAQQGIEAFWGSLELPAECSGVGSLYRFKQENGAATKMLFDSMLKRKDMKIAREERSHTYIFHTGRTSPSRWAEDADLYNEDPVPE